MPSFSGFRRREARAVNSGNLAWSDTQPRDVDYVAARGMSGHPLGALLESLKWGNDHRAYGAALGLLASKFHKRTGRPALRPLLHTALHEWLDDNCPGCGGRGEIMDARGVMSECRKCAGTGKREFSEMERAHKASLSVGSWKQHERDYQIVLECLRGDVAAHRLGAMQAFGVEMAEVMA